MYLNQQFGVRDGWNVPVLYPNVIISIVDNCLHNRFLSASHVVILAVSIARHRRHAQYAVTKQLGLIKEGKDMKL